MADRNGYDANVRAGDRESGPVKLGEQTYYPKRLSNKTIRSVRKLARRGGTEAERIAKDCPDYQVAFDEAIGDGKTDDEARVIAMDAGEESDEFSAHNAKNIAQQLAMLLRTTDNQDIPEEVLLKHLEEDMDARDVGPLMGYLLGSDPTPEETKTS